MYLREVAIKLIVNKNIVMSKIHADFFFVKIELKQMNLSFSVMKQQCICFTKSSIN